MDRFIHEDRRTMDVSTVESQRNDLIPEGHYGYGLQAESLGKSRPWRIGLQSPFRFDCENQALHAGLSREYPGEDDYDAVYPEVRDEP